MDYNVIGEKETQYEIEKHLYEIRNILNHYYITNGYFEHTKYLNMTIGKNYIAYNNRYWNDDTKAPLNKTINDDGTVR